MCLWPCMSDVATTQANKMTPKYMNNNKLFGYIFYIDLAKK